MKSVKIIKNWDEPDLIRQTPGMSGIWKDIRFSFDHHAECDYLIVLNFIPDDIVIDTVPGKTWALMQEPYIANKFDWVVSGHDKFDKVFTHHVLTGGDKYVGTQTCLPWHINKTYDSLSTLEIPAKSKTLSWITSNKRVFPGHKERMTFYEALTNRSDIELDLFGYGINPIVDKWDGLAPYKYSLAIENSSSPHYWTEKISDCLLSYSLPFYYGCTNLADYLPEDCFIQIDINQVDRTVDTINRAIAENQWEKRIDAIREARQLILNKYQLFPFIADQIERHDQTSSGILANPVSS